MRRKKSHTANDWLNFNPRTHVGCDAASIAVLLHCWNFNPRTHVGCDNNLDKKPSKQSISIHAPTWGATYQNDWALRINEISIHAPTWGATESGAIYLSVNKFQSTHPRGVRLNGDNYPAGTTVFQSTHPRGVRPQMLLRGTGV